MKKMPMVKRILAAAMVIAMVATSGNMDWNLIRSKADTWTTDSLYTVDSGGSIGEVVKGISAGDGLQRLNSVTINVATSSTHLVTATAKIYTGASSLNETIGVTPTVTWGTQTTTADNGTLTFSATSDVYLANNETVTVVFDLSSTDNAPINFQTLATATADQGETGLLTNANAVNFASVALPVCSCGWSDTVAYDSHDYYLHSGITSVTPDQTTVGLSVNGSAEIGLNVTPSLNRRLTVDSSDAAVTATINNDTDVVSIVAGASPGTSTVSVKCGDTVMATITVNVFNLVVTLSAESVPYVYNNGTQRPGVSVKVGDTSLTEDVDYAINWPTDTVSAGEKKITVTGMGAYAGYSVEKTYTVTQLDISTDTDMQTLFNNGSYDIDVNTNTLNSATVSGLTYGVDYTLSAPVRGTVTTTNISYSMTATGIGNYKGSCLVSCNYTLTNTSGVNLADIVQLGDIANQTYTGTAITPSIVFYDINDPTKTISLNQGTDYTVSYSPEAHTNSGKVTVTVTGTGKYTGTLSTEFKINKKSIAISQTDITVTVGATKNYDNGNAVLPDVTVTRVVNGASVTLTPGTDYKVTAANNYNIGTASYTVTGIGNYTGSRTGTFNIVADLAAAEITIEGDYTAQSGGDTGYTVTYEGRTIEPEVDSVVLGGVALDNTQYHVEYPSASNTNAGTGRINIIGDGEYAGKEAYVTYTIEPITATKAAFKFTPSSSSAVYTGSDIKPGGTVKAYIYAPGASTKSWVTLTETTDYTISYSDNKNVGNAGVTITGNNNFIGEKTFSNAFEIKARDISTTTITVATGSEYDGTPKTPAVSVSYGGQPISDANYTVSYDNNIEVTTNDSKGIVTLTGKGNLTGTTTKTFDISARSFIGNVRIELDGVDYGKPTGSSWTVNTPTTMEYTGFYVYPVVKVYDNDVLVSSTNYGVSYADNVNVGTTAKVIITGKKRYKGEAITTFFTISKKSLGDGTKKDASISLDKSDIKNGNLVIKDTKKPEAHQTLTLGTDYTIVWGDNDGTTVDEGKTYNANAGLKKVTVTATDTGNYSGGFVYEYSVGTDISTSDKISVQYGRVKFNESSQLSNETKTIGVDAVNTHTQNNEATFDTYYLGDQARPMIKLISSEDANIADHYEVKYNEPNGGGYDAGSRVTVTIKAKDSDPDYYGEITLYYDVKQIKNATHLDTNVIKDPLNKHYAYTGEEVDVFPTLNYDTTNLASAIKYEGTGKTTTLTKGVDYTVSSEDSLVESGTKTVTVTFTGTDTNVGNFQGSYTTTITIDPASPSTIYVGESTTNVVNVLATQIGAGEWGYPTTLESRPYTGDVVDPFGSGTWKLYYGTTNTKRVTLGANSVTYYKNVDSNGVPTDPFAAGEGPTEPSKTYYFKIDLPQNFGTDAVLYGAFTIAPQALKDGECTMDVSSYEYDGTPHTPLAGEQIHVKYNGEEVSKTLYDVVITPVDGEGIGDNTYTLPGKYKVEIKGKSTSTFSTEVAFTKYYTIYAKLSSSSDLVVGKEKDSSRATIAGHSYEITKTVVNGSNTYTSEFDTTWKYKVYLYFKDNDYSLPYYAGYSADSEPSKYFNVATGGLTTPGDGTVTITGDGTYIKGSLTYNVKAKGKLEDATISGWSDGRNYAYTGQAIVPSVTLTYNGKKLIRGVDYSLTANNNVDVALGNTPTGPQLDIDEVSGGYYTGSKTSDVNFNILYDLSRATVVLDKETYEYNNGAEVKPSTVTVNYKKADGSFVDGGLVPNTDYTIEYPDDDYTNAGTVSLVINPTSDRSFNSKTKNYKIVGLNIENATVEWGQTSFNYDGEEKKLNITVTNNGAQLVEGTHYTVSYSNNTDASTDTVKAKAVVKGIGNYSGSKEKEFTINPKGIASGNLTMLNSNIPYNGGNNVILTNGTDYEVIDQVGTSTVTLKEGKDYTIDIEPKSTVGSKGDITITGIGNYGSSVTVNDAYTVVKADLSKADISATESTEYTGSEIDITQIVEVNMASKVKSGTTITTQQKKLNYGTDYTVAVSGTNGGTKLTNVEEYTLTLTGAGTNFEGSVEIPFKITKRQLSDNAENFTYDSAKFTWKIGTIDGTTKTEKTAWDYPTDGSAVKPAVIESVDIGLNPDKTLVEGTDFTVDWDKNTVSGAINDPNGPVVVVTGMGNYEGTVKLHFSIGTDISTADVEMAQSAYPYDGKSHTPKVKAVTLNGNTVPKTDYTVEYPEDTTNAGQKTVTIKGTGAYYGTNTNGTYTINQATATDENIVIIPKGYELDSTTNRYYTTYPGAEYIEDNGGLTPELEVYDSATKTTLRADDFELVDPGFKNNDRVGTANFKIKLKGNYESQVIPGSFDIVGRSISAGSVKLEDGNGNEIDAKEWTGQEIKEADDFEIIVSDDLGNVLTKDDYSLSYTNNTAVGKEATITVTGKRNYKDTLDKKFVIYGVLSADNITIPDAFYTGRQIVPHPTVVVAGKTLEEGTDYTVTSSADDWETATEATAEIIVKDQVLYRPAYVSKNFNISTNASSLHLAGFANEAIYTGRPIKQAVNVVDGAGNIVVSYPEGSTEVTYTSSNTGDTDCIAAGTITMTVPVTVYNGTTQELTATYEIKKKNINACRFSKLSNEYYTGQKLYAPVVVVDGQTELTGRRSDETPKDGVEYDYIVTYSNNIAPGVATVVIAGDGNYTGTKQMTFVIQAPRMNTLSAYGISDSQVLVRWNRSNHADGYKLTYTVNGVKKTAYTKSTSYTISGLNAATNYTVEVNAYVTIGGVEKDGIAKSVSVTTYVKTPDYILTSPSTGQAQISWSVVNNGATGYSIYRSTKASDLNKNSVDELVNYRVADVPATRTSWVNTGLTGGQTYYYRVQAYQIASDGTETYGTLSAIKSVTVK